MVCIKWKYYWSRHSDGTSCVPFLFLVSSFSFLTLTCVEQCSFWWTCPSDLPIPKWSARVHRPWTWASLAWIAIISPNAPAAPVSPGPSVPVAVVPSGSSVPAAGTSSGIGVLAIAHIPASQLRRVGGNSLLLPDLDLSLLLIVLRNYLHEGLSAPTWGLLFGFWSFSSATLILLS